MARQKQWVRQQAYRWYTGNIDQLPASNEGLPLNGRDQSSQTTSLANNITFEPAMRNSMSLTAMPRDVVIQIIEESRPDGFERLVLTSKAVYNLAAPQIIPEHNDFKSRYSTCIVGGQDSGPGIPTNYFYHPTYLLQELQVNPLAARYVKRLELDNCEECNQEDVKARAKQLDFTMLKDNFYLRETNQNARRWTDLILDGNALYGTVLLFLMLLDVETLRLHYLWELKYEESKNDDARQVLDAIAIDDRPQRALSRLNQMAPWDSDERSGISFDVVRPFMALSSMRRLVAFRMVAGDGEHNGAKYTWPYGNRVSQVEHVECTGGSADRDGLEAFLTSMRNLRIFKWDHGGFGNGTGYFFNGGAFMNCVKRRVSETLVQLTLTSWTDSLTAVDSFKEFRRLEYLEFEGKFLYGEQDQGESDEKLLGRLGGHDWKIDYGKFQPPRLIDILPSSLCRLRLINSLEQINCAILFDGFAEAREVCLPALSRIELATKESFPEELIDKMKKGRIDFGHSDYTRATHYITVK